MIYLGDSFYFFYLCLGIGFKNVYLDFSIVFWFRFLGRIEYLDGGCVLYLVFSF